MWYFIQSLTAARTALIYVTLGALLVIWTGIWYFYLYNNPPETASVYYWCSGLLISGLALIFIGCALGRIDQAAQLAAAAPPQVLYAAAPQPNAVVLSPVAPTPAPGEPVVVPGVQAVVAPPQQGS